MAKACIFCKIIAGQSPAHIVYEDEHVLVFMDAFPVTDGHTLVVTKEHAPTILDASQEALLVVMATATRVAHAIRQVMQPDGLMVFQLNGVAAGQTVFHYHMHLLPRAEGEPLALHGRVPGDPERLRTQAERFAAALPPPTGQRPR